MPFILLAVAFFSAVFAVGAGKSAFVRMNPQQNPVATATPAATPVTAGDISVTPTDTVSVPVTLSPVSDSVRRPTPTPTNALSSANTPTPTGTPVHTATATPTVSPTPTTIPDTTPPVFDFMTGPADGSTVNFNSYCFPMRLTDNFPGTIQVRFSFDSGPGEWGTNYAPCYQNTSNGFHVFVVQGRDAAGNMTETRSRGFYVQVGTPTPTIVASE